MISKQLHPSSMHWCALVHWIGKLKLSEYSKLLLQTIAMACRNQSNGSKWLERNKLRAWMEYRSIIQFVVIVNRVERYVYIRLHKLAISSDYVNVRLYVRSAWEAYPIFAIDNTYIRNGHMPTKWSLQTQFQEERYLTLHYCARLYLSDKLKDVSLVSQSVELKLTSVIDFNIRQRTWAISSWKL